jgi:signal peptidase
MGQPIEGLINKKQMKIFNILYYLFITAIAVIAILLLISVFPITGNFKVLAVLSGSMEPSVHTGSIVVVKPSEFYKIGDVITFGKISKRNTPTTHRINEVKNSTSTGLTYITKGDANNAPDLKEVRPTEIVGKEILTIPYVGYAINTAKKPWGFALIIIVPALLVIFDEAKKIKDEVKKMKVAKNEKLNENEPPKI